MARNQQNADALGCRLTDLRGQLSRIDERRRSVFEALEDDTLQPGELRWRLDDLIKAEEQLCDQIRAVEHERELALHRSVQLGDLRCIVRPFSAAMLDECRHRRSSSALESRRERFRWTCP